MPSTRPLVSGRDFQLRYTIHRLTLLALGRDPLRQQTERVRMEWPLRASDGKTVWADLVLESASGEVLEIAECKEHDRYLDLRSVKSFLTMAGRFPSKPMRFVSNGRFLRDGTDFADPAARAAAVRGADDPRLTWELGTPSKAALTGECLLHFTAASSDARSLYSRLYARLAGQMSARLRKDGEVFIAAVRDLHQFLFAEVEAARLSADLSIDPEESFAVEELRHALATRARPHAQAVTISRELIDSALRRNLFNESKASLEAIFVEPLATATLATSDADRAHLTDSALSLMFQWLASRRQRVTSRIPDFDPNELLVVGHFGSGKSSLLTMFAARLLESGSAIAPLLIPLRDLIAAGSAAPLLDVLRDYVRARYGMDPGADATGEYCLLLDGFDELNLFYSRRDQEQWVEQAYRQLISLGQRRNLSVVVSSRPILLMGTRAAARRGTTRLDLDPFTREQIAAWCDRYRSAASLDPRFAIDFLDARNLVDVARTPIVLYMIARIFETAPDLLEERQYTRAEIYRLFIDWTERGRYAADEEKHAVPASYRVILQDIAWHIFQGGRGFIEEAELLARVRSTWGESIEGVPAARNLLVAHMLQPAGPATGRSAIEFTHQSFREYLVAERLWRILQPVFASHPLTPERWAEAFGRPFTSEKVALLNDMVMALDEDAATHLFEALDRAENLHTYWNEWSKPFWEMPVEETKLHFETLPARAYGQAVLAAVLRIRCAERLADRVQPMTGKALGDLLFFADSFGGIGAVGMSRQVLLENLRGLRLEAGQLQRTFLTGANFAGCNIENTNFDQTNLTSIRLENSVFRNCSFEGASFTADTIESSLIDCDFSYAEILIGSSAADGFKTILSGCRFEHASVGLNLEESTLVGIDWTGAQIGEVTLRDCTVDKTTHRVLKKVGALMENCTIR